MLKSADIVLFIVDNSRELDSNDYDIISLLSDKKVIVVVNKCDLENKADLSQIPFKDVISISTATGENIEELKEKLLQFVISTNTNNNSVVITNTRHINALKDAITHCKTALKSLNDNNLLDLVSIDIKNIWLSLGDITGNSDNEKIIDDIFAKFCVGK